MHNIPISIHEVDKLWADRSYRVQLVPAFYVMQQRELISDSVRRKFVLDCPVAEVMREYKNRTDLFFEIGGFFGDCAVGALVGHYASVGVVELDASASAIRALNRTVAASFTR